MSAPFWGNLKRALSPDTLSTRLIALILTALIPLAGLMVYDQLTSRRQAARQTLDTARRLATLAFENYHMTAEGARQLLAALAQTPYADPASGNACSDFMAGLIRQHPQYLNIGVVDPRGSIVCSALPAPTGTRLADRLYIRKAVETRAFSVGEFQIGRITGQASVNFGYPVLDKAGRLKGVVFAALGLKQFDRLAASAQLPPGTVIAVFDRNGVVLSRYPDPEKWIGKKLPEAPYLLAPGAPPTVEMEAPGHDGATRLYALMPLEHRADNGVFLTVGLPKKASLAVAERIFLRDAAVLALLVLMLLLIARWPAEKLILGPVRALLAAASKLGAGHLAARTGLPADKAGELGQLAAAFDRMAESLEQRDAQRCEAEKSLKESRRVLTTLLSNLPGMVYRCRNHGEKWVVEFVSDACAALTGYQPEEMTGDNAVSYLSLVHPEDLPRLQEEIRNAVAALRPYHITYRIKAKDGTEKWVWEQARAVDAPEGFTLEGFTTDITEKKTIEAQFLRTQRMESLGTLAGGIAHDLNNVLAPILMAVPILQKSARDPQAKEFLDLVQSSAKRGVDMVRQVLTFSRGSKGERVPLQVGSLIKEMQKIVSDTFPKNIEVTSRIPENLAAVLGDPTHIHQVLLNLCVNARDAMPKGGAISISAENAAVDAAAAARHPGAEAGPHVLVKVQDNGTGIPPEVLPKTFDPFFTTKEPGKGTGIGLSTVAGILKGHGGFLEIHTQPGQGTRFDLFFPAVAGREAAAATAEAAPPPAGQGEMIMVVDDEASIREMAKVTLQAYNYRVAVARDGAEALALYAQHGLHSIDVVLLDIAMPVMDGVQAFRVLKKLNPQAKIVLTSGLQLPAELADVGEIHFLPKPYTPDKLLNFLREVLQGAPQTATAPSPAHASAGAPA